MTETKAVATTRINLTFEEQLTVLDAFVAEHGHAAVPQNYVTGDGYQLGQRVKSWRQEHNRDQLAHAKRDALAARTGWVWRASKRNRSVTADGAIERIEEDPFEERLRALRLFAHEHGHTQMPSSMVTLTGVNLGHWVRSQRGMYRARMVQRHGRNWLRDEHIAALEAVPHWTWEADLSTVQWEEKFTQLLDTVAKTGTSFIPRRADDVQGVGRWVSTQRRLHRQGKQPADRAARLAALPGWVWDGSFINNTFDVRVEELRAYIAEHPGCTRYSDVLNRWVSRRRTDYARGELTQAKIDVLNAIPGWDWLEHQKRNTGPTPPRKKQTAPKQKKVMATGLRPLSPTMQYNLDRIATYAKANGHARVPHLHVEDDGMRLGLVVKNLQDRADTLHPVMVEGLTAIPGWTWTKPAAWDLNEALAALDTFVAEHGHARVPRGYVTDTGVPLGARVETWRRQALAAQMPVAVTRELESKPGWLWTARSSTTLAA